MCGYEKLDAKGKAEAHKLTAYLNEIGAIHDKFKNQPTALLCRNCVQKTKYTHSDYNDYLDNKECEICGDAETLIGVAGGWSDK